MKRKVIILGDWGEGGSSQESCDHGKLCKGGGHKLIKRGNAKKNNRQLY